MSAARKNPRPLVGRGQGVGGVQTHHSLQANAQRSILNRALQRIAPPPLPLPHKGGGSASLGDAA
jgi:hypothetical protein